MMVSAFILDDSGLPGFELCARLLRQLHSQLIAFTIRANIYPFVFLRLFIRKLIRDGNLHQFLGKRGISLPQRGH